MLIDADKGESMTEVILIDLGKELKERYAKKVFSLKKHHQVEEFEQENTNNKYKSNLRDINKSFKKEISLSAIKTFRFLSISKTFFLGGSIVYIIFYLKCFYKS